MELTTIKWSNGKRNNMMEEQAKEELEILEDQYPNQYEFLKQELRTFILELQNSKHQDSELLPQNNHCNTSLALLLDTEESTSLEQVKKSNCGGTELALEADRDVMQGKVDESSELESLKAVVKEQNSSRKKKRKDRVDLVLERAQNCLKKLQHLKTSLLSPS
ncbi:uncharacterized protein LOC130723358 [Lotus japonicus]|uniref:uncharacterized protein LOC130723358 n=1 Tax=Lotus japonicus TaxID=34305 RepID=UPI00258A7081|nr:uncharacterized protein LOC130723358 [Lotus japonicus]